MKIIHGKVLNHSNYLTLDLYLQQKQSKDVLYLAEMPEQGVPRVPRVPRVPLSHLICTLISENEGLEKSRSASNLRKISVPAHLNFFSVCHLNFFQIYGINLKKIQVTN